MVAEYFMLNVLLPEESWIIDVQINSVCYKPKLDFIESYFCYVHACQLQ